ncbi:hypothetical protein SELMODRAFT_448296 [Selaginella moellendorffii]|uniref:Thioredoxin domain-containing protein n=1 Tax=Selaginella moellendorffii TaxID=88036 RepID=D8T683_SELML|nr:thioredoxin domain-containing protein [Selaginella moellendorffii]EFJ07868.1 hypothetical protein SELMODRAFT_448296 [Selaginella moellendorffii]|eukprot:XP_002991060.1 thioredoxin domain-containing protein [Selaginella moellendorffii]
MERPVLLLLLLLLVFVAAGACAAAGDDAVEGPHLLYLSDRNFEHDTQAATGQTTGSWLVLFTDPDFEGGKDAELALRKLLEETRDGHPLFAKVDVAKSPKTRKRFSITNPPQLKLFHDRRMFDYSGDWTAETISEFVKQGWKETRAEEVPPEAALGGDLMEAFQHKYSQALQFLGSHPMALAVAGTMVAVAGYSITSGILGGNGKARRRSGKKSARGRKKD